MSGQTLAERLRELSAERAGDGPSGPNYDPELLELLNDAAGALSAAEERIKELERDRSAIQTEANEIEADADDARRSEREWQVRRLSRYLFGGKK